MRVTAKLFPKLVANNERQVPQQLCVAYQKKSVPFAACFIMSGQAMMRANGAEKSLRF